MGHLTKTGHHSEDGCVAIRWGETCVRVQGTMGPRAMRHRERQKETTGA